MSSELMTRLIWGAGAVHLGIGAANVPLPGRLRVRERLAGVPRFLRQIFYVRRGLGAACDSAPRSRPRPARDNGAATDIP